MQDIITQFADRYRLTATEVMVEIESALSAILSKWYQLEVIVSFREDLLLEAVAYSNNRGVIRQDIVNITVMNESIIKLYLEKALEKAALFKQIRRYKAYEKELLWGEITTCDRERNLYVETEIIPGEQILAICPANRIGLHERYSRYFLPGQRRAFHLRRVEPVELNGTPRLKIVVDRVSKTLVETLMRNQIKSSENQLKICCVKRYVGHKSLVLATSRLPKAAIVAVDRELRERIQVEVVKTLPT
ncbi:MAG: hypothetical protein F9K32_05975 [Desulfobulbaceae bacterium]|nr:MAG: hypothetical protein F9K32_05975 [Desulfobulbaceae bacterium]